MLLLLSAGAYTSHSQLTASGCAHYPREIPHIASKRLCMAMTIGSAICKHVQVQPPVNVHRRSSSSTPDVYRVVLILRPVSGLGQALLLCQHNSRIGEIMATEISEHMSHF